MGKNFSQLDQEFSDAINARIMEITEELQVIMQDASEYVRPNEAEQVAMLFAMYAESAWDSDHRMQALRAAMQCLKKLGVAL